LLEIITRNVRKNFILSATIDDHRLHGLPCPVDGNCLGRHHRTNVSISATTRKKAGDDADGSKERVRI
jgi:hypothetical protein